MNIEKILSDYKKNAINLYYFLFDDVCLQKHKVAQKSTEKIFKNALQNQELMIRILETLKDSNPYIQSCTATWCLFYKIQEEEAVKILIKFAENPPGILCAKAIINLSLYKTGDMNWGILHWEELKEMLKK